MRFAALCLLFFLSNAFSQINYDAGVENGRITYYGKTNCVACDIPQSEWPAYTAALSEKHFQEGLACGATARLMNNGKEIRVLIVDLCPVSGNEEWCSGDMTHFDLMGAETFSLLEPMVTGVKKLTFEWLPTPVGNNPVKLRFKDGINAWWVALQVINHRYPVAKLEIKDPKSGAWILGNRKLPGMWNYWHFAFTGNGLQPPFQIRITDQFNQVIEETATELKEKFMWSGKNQFPLLKQHTGIACSEFNGGWDEKEPRIFHNRLYLPKEGTVFFRIVDLFGKTVYSAAPALRTRVVNLPELSMGTYTIRMQTGDVFHAKRWVVFR